MMATRLLNREIITRNLDRDGLCAIPEDKVRLLNSRFGRALRDTVLEHVIDLCND
jgi:hypothetical protein